MRWTPPPCSCVLACPSLGVWAGPRASMGSACVSLSCWDSASQARATCVGSELLVLAFPGCTGAGGERVALGFPASGLPPAWKEQAPLFQGTMRPGSLRAREVGSPEEAGP